MAGGCKNGAVAAWSEDGTKLFETRPSYAITCTMCDDGSIVVMRESELDKTLVKGHEGPVKCLRWNRHACHLFATGSDDKVFLDRFHFSSCSRGRSLITYKCTGSIASKFFCNFRSIAQIWNILPSLLST